MVKKEFLGIVAEKAGATQKAVGELYNAFVETLVAELKKGEKIQLSGFGNFEVKSKPAREGVNPATGAKIKIAASKSPSFKAAKQFKDAFN